MPTVMKNSPSRMSRNGLITASNWWRYSVSASITPARKPPVAIDTPAAVLACWSDAAQALVPSGRLHLPALAAASAEGLRQQRDSGPAADVQSPQQAVTAVVVLLLFGAGALALTGLLR